MLLAVAPLIVVASAGVTDLAAAHVRGDHDEVARLAGQLGAARVADLLDAPDPTAVHAGLAAAPHTPDGWELLDELADLAGGWDRSVAAPAALAAARIARDLDADDAIAADLPDDALDARARAWAAIAARGERWADVRVHALEVAARLAAARRATADADPGLGYDLAERLGDDEPEVRRAACELVPQPAPAAARAPLARAIAHDEDPAVALACAQALCADLAFDPAPPILAALGDDGAARLRAITGAPLPAVPGGAIVDAARCLAARGTKEDAAAVRALAAKAPREVRAMLRRVASRGGR